MTKFKRDSGGVELKTDENLATEETLEAIEKAIIGRGEVTCLGKSTLTVSSTAVNLKLDSSPVMPSSSKGALITVETDQVRYWMSGNAPTSTDGHLLETSDVLIFNSWDSNKDWSKLMSTTNFIRVTNDATLMISWFD